MTQAESLHFPKTVNKSQKTQMAKAPLPHSLVSRLWPARCTGRSRFNIQDQEVPSTHPLSTMLHLMATSQASILNTQIHRHTRLLHIRHRPIHILIRDTQHLTLLNKAIPITSRLVPATNNMAIKTQLSTIHHPKARSQESNRDRRHTPLHSISGNRMREDSGGHVLCIVDWRLCKANIID